MTYLTHPTSKSLLIADNFAIGVINHIGFDKKSFIGVWKIKNKL